MRYCFLTIGTWEGNASYVRLREFGAQLVGRGIDVTYIVDDITYHRETLKLHPDAKIVFVRSAGLRQFVARRTAVYEAGADVVHILNPAPKTFLALFGQRQKFICDWDEWIAQRKHARLRSCIERFIDGWMRRNAFIPVVCSKYLQTEFRKLGCESTYIPYAAYLPTYEDKPSPFSEPTAVYMGNFYPNYDHDLIFQAAEILKNNGQNPKIAMLGGGPDLEKWRAFIRERRLSNISLPGYVSGQALWQHLRHARVLLFPIRKNILNLSRCPSKTFAYAQARRPIITNHVGEVVEVLGKNANYVDCSAEMIADAIGEMMSRADDPPDVDYQIERHNWADRTDRLLDAMGHTDESPTP